MSALIFDRTQADADRAAYLIGKIQRGETLTESEQAEYFAGLKGCYNIADMNRVETKVRELAETLRSYGYSVDYTVPMKGASVLPSGYTELEYIQSSGTQYIDTGIKPNQDTSIEIEAIPSAVGETYLGEGFCPYAAGVSNNDRAFECYTSQDQYEFDYDGQIAYLATATVGDALKINHSKNVVSLTVNGADVYTQIFEYKSFESPYTLTLFARHRASLVYSKGKIEKCKIKSGDTLVRDFYPAKSINGTVGLFDIVNDVFYTNAGTGTFTAGAEIVTSADREWQRTDTMLESDVLLFLANIAALRNVIQLPPEIPPIPTIDRWIDWIAANDIERIVFELDRIIYGIVPLFRRSGTFRAGKNAQHLLLAKGVN